MVGKRGLLRKHPRGVGFEYMPQTAFIIRHVMLEQHPLFDASALQ